MGDREAILGNMNETEVVTMAEMVRANFLVPTYCDGVMGNLGDMASLTKVAAGRHVHLPIPARERSLPLARALQ